MNLIYCSHIRAILFSSTLSLLVNFTAHADEASARALMSNPNNPLVALFSAKGAIYIELHRTQAPKNIARLIELIEGKHRFPDSDIQSRYYDQTQFYESIPNSRLRTGAAAFNRFGLIPSALEEEIDSTSLGLEQRPLLNDAGEVDSHLAIDSREAFDETILAPLYASLGIENASQAAANAPAVMEQLRAMSVADALENLGHRFTQGLGTPMLLRGDVALSSSPAGVASTELIILLEDSPWLDGQVTAIGSIVEGLNIADAISETEVAPDLNINQATAIYSLRVL